VNCGKEKRFYFHLLENAYAKKKSVPNGIDKSQLVISIKEALKSNEFFCTEHKNNKKKSMYLSKAHSDVAAAQPLKATKGL
jgi:hypothetical protein